MFRLISLIVFALATLAGPIEHSGGLEFTAGDTTLGVQDFVIDTAAGVLTARSMACSSRRSPRANTYGGRNRALIGAASGTAGVSA